MLTIMSFPKQITLNSYNGNLSFAPIRTHGIYTQENLKRNDMAIHKYTDPISLHTKVTHHLCRFPPFKKFVNARVEYTQIKDCISQRGSCSNSYPTLRSHPLEISELKTQSINVQNSLPSYFIFPGRRFFSDSTLIVKLNTLRPKQYFALAWHVR